MRRPVLLLGWAICGALLTGSASRAEMVLSEVILDMAASEKRRDIEVWNSGAETLYIESYVEEVIDPELAEPTEQRLTDPRSAGLLVSPARMVLAPDERKLLRVVVRKSAVGQDLVYRVAVAPKENPAETDDGLAVKILIGYKVLVIVRPPDAKPDLRIERDGKQLHFENRGNSSILIRRITQCASSGDDCIDLNGNRLYAGETWTTELPADAPVRVLKSFGLENSASSH